MQNYNSKITIKALLILFCALIFLKLTSNSSVFAAISISFNNAPITIDQGQEFTIDVSLICSGCTSDSYIRSVFYPSGTSYFGYTQNNGGNWINAQGGNCTQYFKIEPSELTEGSWSGKLKVKPDISSSFYSGPGDYLFKVGRYSTSCSSPAWSTETTLTITGPTPTSTLTPTLIPIPPTSPPTNTPAPTSPSQSTPTVTSVPNSGSLAPTKKPTIVPAVYGDDYNENKPTDVKNNVLGESVSVTTEPTITITEQNNKDSQLSFGLLFILIAGGIICIGSAIILSVKEIRKKEKIFF